VAGVIDASHLTCFLEAWSACTGQRGLDSGDDGIPESLRRDVRRLLADFRDELGGGKLIATLSRASATLEQIGHAIHWDDGLRDTVVALVDHAVQLAERNFGPSTGAYKRQFVIDVALETISRDYLQIPLSNALADLFEPVFSAVITWTVEILNRHLGQTWYDEPTVKPTRRRTLGVRLRTQLRVYIVWLRFWDWLTKRLLAPTRYDRRLARARKALAPQIAQLQRTLPRQSLFGVAGELGPLVHSLGALITPHIRTIERLVRFARSERVRLADRKGRQQILVAVLQQLLGEAYRDDPLIVSLIRSDLGALLLRDLVSGAEVILERNGLLPQAPQPALPAIA
jgi:hypothetical protein